MKKAKEPPAKWIVRLDGLRVYTAGSWREAQNMSDALGKEAPARYALAFTVAREPASTN